MASTSDTEAPRRRLRIPRFIKTPAGAVGFGMIVFLLLVAFVGPLVAPHSLEAPIGVPGAPPGNGAPLGTDALGRDVLSRVLHGGSSVILLGTISTVLAYAVGLTVGLVSGYTRTLIDPILMRSVDILLAFPALLVLLLLVSGLGTSEAVLVLGVVLVQLPGIARTTRTATLEVSTRGFVEASVVRGERMPAILRRDIIPNIAPVLLADFGIRYGYSVILIASMNYLGLGLAPPAADWGLMISENRQYLSSNAWSVLAPAILLAMLTIGVNLMGDAYARTMGTSARSDHRASPPKAMDPSAQTAGPAADPLG